MQVHCGFGDADLFLPGGDPSLPGPLVERFAGTPFVLLHCYPFVRQASWLAHVYATSSSTTPPARPSASQLNTK